MPRGKGEGRAVEHLVTQQKQNWRHRDKHASPDETGFSNLADLLRREIHRKTRPCLVRVGRCRTEPSMSSHMFKRVDEPGENKTITVNRH